MMHGRCSARSAALGGLGLMLLVATGALTGPACAQAMQLSGFNAFDPQWALAGSHMSSGFDTANGISQQTYTTKFDSGTFGVFAASRNDGLGAFASPIDRFGSVFGSGMPFRQDWFADAGNPAWSKSILGSYKSNPDAALNGLYTTASFGVTNFATGPAMLPGLSNFSAGNEATAITAKAGVGLQLTPQISIEGSVGVTQLSGSGFSGFR